MKPEQTPQTVRAWLSDIANKGSSTRPVPPGESDLLNETLPDTEDMKPERGAYGAIVATRTYQRAKKIILAQKDNLSLPNAAKITTIDDFITKNYFIGEAFKEAMTNSLLRDERLAKKLPPQHRVANVYRRLEEIVAPALRVMPEEKKQDIRRKVRKPDLQITGAFLEIQGGIAALPDNMNTLAGNIVTSYEQKFRKHPDIPTILGIMKHSYESYIEVLAKLHQADSTGFAIAERMMKRRGGKPHELQDDALHFTTQFFEVIRDLREKTRAERSRTITCVFRTPTSETQPFLDQRADFDDPLRDAFNLHMQFLSA